MSALALYTARRRVEGAVACTVGTAILDVTLPESLIDTTPSMGPLQMQAKRVAIHPVSLADVLPIPSSRERRKLRRHRVHRHALHESWNVASHC